MKLRVESKLLLILALGVMEARCMKDKVSAESWMILKRQQNWTSSIHGYFDQYTDHKRLQATTQSALPSSETSFERVNLKWNNN